MKSTDLPKSAPKPPIWHSPPTRMDGDIREWICANGSVQVVCFNSLVNIYRYTDDGYRAERIALPIENAPDVVQSEIEALGGITPTVKESLSVAGDELLTVDVCAMLIPHQNRFVAQELLRRADTRTLLTALHQRMRSNPHEKDDYAPIVAKALGISEDQ